MTSFPTQPMKINWGVAHPKGIQTIKKSNKLGIFPQDQGILSVNKQD